MNHGVIRLWVKTTEDHPWGLLEAFKWDGAYRKRSEWRAAIIEQAHNRQAGWTRNYGAYVNASFCIEEQTDPTEPPIHLSGRRRLDKERKRLLVETPSSYGRGMTLAPSPVLPPASPLPTPKVVYYKVWPTIPKKPGGMKRRIPACYIPVPGGLRRKLPKVYKLERKAKREAARAEKEALRLQKASEIFLAFFGPIKPKRKKSWVKSATDSSNLKRATVKRTSLPKPKRKMRKGSVKSRGVMQKPRMKKAVRTRSSTRASKQPSVRSRKKASTQRKPVSSRVPSPATSRRSKPAPSKKNRKLK